MVDEQDGTPLTQEQDAAVRRLVAEARHDEPIPATVAARLDKVLAHLAAEADAPTKHAVADLDTRRRRRTAGRLLLAAAAVVVGGVAVGQMIGTNGLSTSGSDADSADTGAERNAAGEDSGLTKDTDEPGQTAEGADPETAAGAAKARVLRTTVPVSLSTQSFDADVRRIYRQTRLAKRAAADFSSPSSNSYLDKVDRFDCPPAAYGTGILLPAYFDGEPAVLAFRPPVGSQRMAELLACGTAEPLDDLQLAYDPAD